VRPGLAHLAYGLEARDRKVTTPIGLTPSPAQQPPPSFVRSRRSLAAKICRWRECKLRSKVGAAAARTQVVLGR
jgi:hypothetical protein